MFIMGESFVYILASRRNGTLYVGSTTNLAKRVWEHKNKVIPGFTAKYSVHQLVYYEMHQDIMEAAWSERRFKNWRREWKINMIEKFNPTWRDLYEEICV
jgi:putative endonuclease